MNKTLYVKHLTRNIKEDHLREIFSAFGEIKKVEIVLEKRTQLPLDYGFVEFSRHVDANLAMECMHEVGEPPTWLLPPLTVNQTGQD